MLVAITTTGGAPQVYVDIDTDDPMIAAQRAWNIATSGEPFKAERYSFPACPSGGSTVFKLDPEKIDAVRVEV